MSQLSDPIYLKTYLFYVQKSFLGGQIHSQKFKNWFIYNLKTELDGTKLLRIWVKGEYSYVLQKFVNFYHQSTRHYKINWKSNNYNTWVTNRNITKISTDSNSRDPKEYVEKPENQRENKFPQSLMGKRRCAGTNNTVNRPCGSRNAEADTIARLQNK